MNSGSRTDTLEEFELASARLEWARAASCQHLPAQREALDWHLACYKTAHDALHARDDIGCGATFL